MASWIQWQCPKTQLAIINFVKQAMHKIELAHAVILFRGRYLLKHWKLIGAQVAHFEPMFRACKQ